jgi:hypothetical protein
MLAASTGKEPPAPAQQLVNQATITAPKLAVPKIGAPKTPKIAASRIGAPPKKHRAVSKSKFPLTVGILLVAIGTMGWLMHYRINVANAQATLAAAAVEEPLLPDTASERASQRAAELSAGLQARQTEALQPGQIFSPDQHDLLFLREGMETTVQGRLENIRPSGSGKTMYLQFSKDANKNQTCGAVAMEGAPPDLSENDLRPLIGKPVRLKGTLKTHRLGGLKRPEILITNRASISVVEE